MASPDLTSGTVMDQAASLNNDSAKSIYTYPIQLPYLNQALQELQEYFELNEVPVVDTFSAVMTVPAGVDFIQYSQSDMSLPSLPDDLIEPQVLWERQSGIDPYVQMTRLDYLPRYLAGQEMNQFIYYVWQTQQIKFLPANQINQIRMDYIRNLFVRFTSTTGTDQVNVVNAASFLEFRTGALLAQFVGENKTRADDLNGFASLAMDRAVGIGTKGRQTIFTRHRPFRSSYKQRNNC